MSDGRIPDTVFHVRLPRKHGKIVHEKHKRRKYELYGAVQFTGRYDPVEKNFYPQPPTRLHDRVEWNSIMYRVRIDGSWYNLVGFQYSFFTMEEILLLLQEFAS